MAYTIANGQYRMKAPSDDLFTSKYDLYAVVRKMCFQMCVSVIDPKNYTIYGSDVFFD